MPPKATKHKSKVKGTKAKSKGSKVKATKADIGREMSTVITTANRAKILKMLEYKSSVDSYRSKLRSAGRRVLPGLPPSTRM